MKTQKNEVKQPKKERFVISVVVTKEEKMQITRIAHDEHTIGVSEFMRKKALSLL